jgi:hypothetical protein
VICETITLPAPFHLKKQSQGAAMRLIPSIVTRGKIAWFPEREAGMLTTIGLTSGNRVGHFNSYGGREGDNSKGAKWGTQGVCKI